jgi:RED-like protein N-terminal region
MEAPTPRRSASSDLLKGRDATQIEELKKLIVSEKQRAKAGGDAGSASGSEDEAEGDELSKAAKNKKKALEALEAAKKVKPKGVWRKGVFIAAEDLEENRYRDRAQERRTGENPDYDGEIEKMVEVDAEKSKYLGGDLKHTHLVRGLDYALLLKVKEETRRKEEEDRIAREALEQQAGNLRSQQQAAEAEGAWHPPTIRTYSGKALYAAMQTVAKLKAPDFSRIAYEFDLSDDAVTDVPTMLTRSTAAAGAAAAADDDEITTVNYIMEDELLARMQDSLEQFRLHGKPGRRRKRKLSSSTTATNATGDHDFDDDDAVSVSSSTPSTSAYGRPQQRYRAAHDNISLFDDDVGTYVPPEAAVPSTAAAAARSVTVTEFVPPLPPPVPVHNISSTSSSSSSFQPPLPPEQPPLPPLPPTDYASISSSMSSSSSSYVQPALPPPPLPQEPPVAIAVAVPAMPAGGVFSGLRVAHTSSKAAAAAAMDIDDDSHITGDVAAPSKEEISKSIRAAAAAAKRSATSSTAAAAAAAAAVSTADAGKIDRDIFGAGANGRVNGHSLAQGTYDVFPETAEYADAGESDSEGEGTSSKAHSKLGEQLSKKAEKGSSSRAAASGSKDSGKGASRDSTAAGSSSSAGKDNRRERRKRKAEESSAT